MNAISNTVNDLLDECRGFARSPAYITKMMHSVPKRPVLDVREVLFMTACRQQVVLDVGASGHLHQALLEVASKVYGLDRHDGEGIVGVDLDAVDVVLPTYPDVTRICCGEILEHLTNPGWLLKRLRTAYPSCPIIVSVPNAFSSVCQFHLKSGVENVNRDHVAWYSPKTLEWLLARQGYRIRTWAWYNGQPYTAEGIVAIADPV